MKSTFNHARSDGHDSQDDVVGGFWFDPHDPKHAQLIYLASDWGSSERIDMVDASYGNLARTAFNSVSWFGGLLLGGLLLGGLLLGGLLLGGLLLGGLLLGGLLLGGLLLGGQINFFDVKKNDQEAIEATLERVRRRRTRR